MLTSLNEAFQRVGLRMNLTLDKAQIIFNAHVVPGTITVDGITFEVVFEHTYLGQLLQLGGNNFEREAKRRIQLSWAAFEKLRHVFSSPFPQPEGKIFNQCVLPVMTCGIETWSLTVEVVFKLKIA